MGKQLQFAKEMVDIVHEYGREAMMFMGITGLVWNHLWICLHPSDWDAVVGSVGNGATLRLSSSVILNM